MLWWKDIADCAGANNRSVSYCMLKPEVDVEEDLAISYYFRHARPKNISTYTNVLELFCLLLMGVVIPEDAPVTLQLNSN